MSRVTLDRPVPMVASDQASIGLRAGGGAPRGSDRDAGPSDQQVDVEHDRGDREDLVSDQKRPTIRSFA